VKKLDEERFVNSLPEQERRSMTLFESLWYKVWFLVGVLLGIATTIYSFRVLPENGLHGFGAVIYLICFPGSLSTGDLDITSKFANDVWLVVCIVVNGVIYYFLGYGIRKVFGMKFSR
jgi:hypothetical protein